MPEGSELETGELSERLGELLEGRTEAESQPAWLRWLSLSTALIAVLAAVASLLSGSFSNDAILEKNEAVLQQAKTSDRWNYYQAKGVKGALAASQAEVVGEANAQLAERLRGEAERYKTEQAQIAAEAGELEAAVEAHNRKAEHLLEQHHQFALAVTLFQISIALGAIAALTRRRLLWLLGLAASAVGLGFGVFGLALRA